MRHYLLVIGWGLFFVSLEGTWLHDWLPDIISVDFLFIGVVALSFSQTHFRRGLYDVLILGFIFGIFASMPIGIFMLRNLVVYFVVRFVVQNIYLRSFEGRIFWVTTVIALSAVLTSFMFYVVTRNIEYLVALVKFGWVNVICTSLVALAVIPVLNWLWDLNPNETVESASGANAW